jgi:hypothetical protein
VISKRDRLARARARLADLRREARTPWSEERVANFKVGEVKRERRRRLAAQRDEMARAREERRPWGPLPAPRKRLVQLFTSAKSGEGYWNMVGERLAVRLRQDGPCNVCGCPTIWGLCPLCSAKAFEANLGGTRRVVRRGIAVERTIES